MKRARMIAVMLALATLVGGIASAQMGPEPRGPMGPGQMLEQMGKMLDMMTQMQEQMKGMQGMGPTEGRMGQMMGMMGQMRGMMTQHQELMKQFCPAAGGQLPKQGG